MASPLTTELVAFYDPVDFATDKSLIIDLTNRVADFDTQLPGTAKASHAMTTAVFEEFRRLLAVAQDVSVGLGIDINATITHSSGEVIPLYDFTFPTYAEFEQQVQVNLADIEAQPSRRKRNRPTPNSRPRCKQTRTWCSRNSSPPSG